MSLPSPSQLLGDPSERYARWYPGQENAFNRLMEWYYSPSRFVGVAYPTGSGKSLLSLLLARLTGSRTVILTATKGLQSQYAQDAIPLGAMIVVGQNNFPCPLVPSLRADAGPCHDGIPCPIRDTGCPYRIQLKRALSARILVTNYSYWLAQTNFSSGLGEVGLLICDEGHMAFGAAESYLTVSLSRADIESLGMFFPGTVDQWGVWHTWAESAATVVNEELADLETKVRVLRSQNQQIPGQVSRALRTAKSLSARLGRIASIIDPWVIQRTKYGYRFVPRWVAGYHSDLFHSVPKVAVVSAILSRKTVDCLGVPQGEECAWIEAPSYFPAANTPIWHVPTVRLNQYADDYALTLWVSRIDQVIQRRLDRKGIVFTVSYERSRILLQRSRYRSIMYSHSTGDVLQVVNKFKAAKSPAILVSPTVTTGWDFPEVSYIIVGKIPYPDTRDEVVRARSDEDKSWTSYLAMDVFVQECGRGTRSFDSRCEVLVLDDSVIWFWKAYKSFAPAWFRERYRGSLGTVPDPLV